MENPFSLKGKITGQTLNNFTIIKSITIIVVYVSRLKKILSYSSLLSNTHKLSVSKVAILCTLLSIFFSTHSSLSLLAIFFSLSGSLLATFSFFLCHLVALLLFFFSICSAPTCFLYTKKLQLP